VTANRRLWVANRRYAAAFGRLAADNQKLGEDILPYSPAFWSVRVCNRRVGQEHQGIAEDYQREAEKVFRLGIAVLGLAVGLQRDRVRCKPYEEKVKEPPKRRVSPKAEC